jgi:hypothetical protein
MLQGEPVQKFHDDERLSVLLINLVDGADVGMVQCRCRLCFTLEASESLRILGDIVGQEL